MRHGWLFFAQNASADMSLCVPVRKIEAWPQSGGKSPSEEELKTRLRELVSRCRVYTRAGSLLETAELYGASCPINSMAPVLAIPGMVADVFRWRP